MSRIGEFRRATLLRLAMAVAIALVAFAWATMGYLRHRPPSQLRIGTASPGGAYAKLGEGLAEVLDRELPRTTCTAENTAGSVENLQRLDAGELEFAFAQSDTVGSDDIRMVASLYDEVLHIVVNTRGFAEKPRTMADLQGMTLGIGPVGSGTRHAVQRLLRRYGVEYRDAYVEREIPSTPRALQAFERGEIDALFILSGIPDVNVQRLLAQPHVVLLSVDDSSAQDYDLAGYVESTTGYKEAEIVKGVYGRRRPPHPIETLSVTALLVTRRHVDDQLVYDVARTLVSRKTDLVAFHVVAKQIGETTGLSVQPYVDHPGATAWQQGRRPNARFRLEGRLSWGLGVMALIAAAALTYREERRIRRHERVEDALRGAHGADDHHDVFIAYSTRAPGSTATVHAIAEELEGHGISCWYAPRNIEGGANWSEAIPAAIESTRCAFVLVFCEEANRSEHLARELTLASSAELNIVPFFIEDVEPSGTMKYHTAHVQRIHGFPGQRAEGLGLLLQAIRTLERVPSKEEVESGRPPAPEAPEPAIESPAATPPRPWRRRALAALATAVVLSALGYGIARRAARTVDAPTLQSPGPAALGVGGLLMYEWDYAHHDPDVEYEIERRCAGGDRLIQRVTARSWTENNQDLEGQIHWRVRALREAADGGLKPTEWSAERVCTWYPNTLRKILATGRVAIAMSADALNYVDDEGQSTNLELELIRIALQNALDAGGEGRRLQIDRVYFPWGQKLFRSLEQADCDLITASLTIKSDREKLWHVRFTEPVTEFPPVFVHRADQELCVREGPGKGICRIGVKCETTHEVLANRLAENGRGVRVVPYDVENAYLVMYGDLVAGKLELLLYDEPFAQRVQESAAKRGKALTLTPVDERVMSDPPVERIGIATKRVDDALRTLLNEAIDQHAEAIENLKETLRPREVF